MVTSCSVYGCNNKKTGQTFNKAFHRFPPKGSTKVDANVRKLLKKRRKAWLNALQRKDVLDHQLNGMRVCSDHFISGELISKLRITNTSSVLTKLVKTDRVYAYFIIWKYISYRKTSRHPPH